MSLSTLAIMAQEESRKTSERVNWEFQRKYEKEELTLTSIYGSGVTQAKDGETADTLYTRVDKALYIAKYNGRNQTVKLENVDL